MATMTAKKLKVFQDLNRKLPPIVPVKRIDNRLHCERVHEELLSLSDQFDILRLTRKDIKKLTTEELEALKIYGQAYLKDYENGHLNKQRKHGLPMADFDEAEACSIIKRVMNNIEDEFRQRGL